LAKSNLLGMKFAFKKQLYIYKSKYFILHLNNKLLQNQPDKCSADTCRSSPQDQDHDTKDRDQHQEYQDLHDP